MEIEGHYDFELILTALIHNYPLQEGEAYLSKIHQDYTQALKPEYGSKEKVLKLPFNLGKALTYFQQYRYLRDSVPGFVALGGEYDNNFIGFGLWLNKHFEGNYKILVLAVADKLDAIYKLGPTDMAREMTELEAYAFLARFLNYDLKLRSKQLDIWADRLEAAHFKYFKPQEYEKVRNYIHRHYGMSYEQLVEINQRWVEDINGLIDIYSAGHGIPQGQIFAMGAPKELHSLWRKMNEKQGEDPDIYDLVRAMVVFPKAKSLQETKKNIVRFSLLMKKLFTNDLHLLRKRVKNRLKLPPLPTFSLDREDYNETLRKYPQLFEAAEDRSFRFKGSVDQGKIFEINDLTLSRMFRFSNLKRDPTLHLTYKTVKSWGKDTFLEVLLTDLPGLQEYIFGNASHFSYRYDINPKAKVVYAELPYANGNRKQRLVFLNKKNTLKDLFKEMYPEHADALNAMKYYRAEWLEYRNGKIVSTRQKFKNWDVEIGDLSMIRFVEEPLKKTKISKQNEKNLSETSGPAKSKTKSERLSKSPN
jgi:hypothetical protein